MKSQLDELAVGRLPDRVLTEIGKIDVKIEELDDWAQNIPTLYIRVVDGVLNVRINVQVPTKVAFATVGTVITIIVFAAKNWPAIVALLK